MAHTPAPWTAMENGGDDPDTRPLIVCAQNRYGDWEMVARADGYPPDEGDPLDNARLIAAAPTMLDALRLIDTICAPGESDPERMAAMLSEIARIAREATAI